MSLNIAEAFSEGWDQTLKPVSLKFITIFAALGIVSRIFAQEFWLGLFPLQSNGGTWFLGTPDPILGLSPTVSMLGWILVSLLFVILDVALIRTFVIENSSEISFPGFNQNLGWILSNLIVGGILIGILVGVGFLLLLIPGIFLMVSWYFWNYIVVVEGENFITAMNKSWERARGDRSELFIFVFIITSITIIARGIGQTVAGVTPVMIAPVLESTILAPVNIFSIAVGAQVYLQLLTDENRNDILGNLESEPERAGSPNLEQTQVSHQSSITKIQIEPYKGKPPKKMPETPDGDISYRDVNRTNSLEVPGDANIFSGMVVHEATVNGKDRTTIAIKEPRFDGTLSKDDLERFKHEAETWSRISGHPHIAGIVDWGTDPHSWVAMEYMDSGNIKKRAGDLPFPQAVWTAERIADGVRHAHNYGVLHLDLKPNNILFQEVGKGLWDVPKVSDWGISRLDHQNSYEQNMPSEYAAPEQIAPERFGDTDQRTDIYQLGINFYELFVGDPPFVGSSEEIELAKLKGDITSPSKANPSLPAALDDVLLRALAVEKENRYQSIGELQDDLQKILERVQ